MSWKVLGAALAVLALTVPVHAQTETFAFGGDDYVGGTQAAISASVANDAFAAGMNVDISGPVAGDAHGAGATVNIPANVVGNVYAMGNAVSISGAVGKDVTAAGASVALTGNAPVEGNARLAGAAISIAKPVNGSVLAAAGQFSLSAPVAGDLEITAEHVEFGSGATVAGHVTIRTSADDISVPASVAPADRVTIDKVEAKHTGFDPGQIAENTVNKAWPAWMKFVVAPIVLFVVGTIWLALFPRRTLVAYHTAMRKPVKSFGFGIMGLAAFIGLIPVVAITLFGIPLIPIAAIVLVLAAMIGYVAGTWFLATRILDSFGWDYVGLGHRIVALIVGLAVAAVLSLVPFLGWLIQLLYVFFGLGGIVLAALGRWIDTDFHRHLADEVAAVPN